MDDNEAIKNGPHWYATVTPADQCPTQAATATTVPPQS